MVMFLSYILFLPFIGTLKP